MDVSQTRPLVAVNIPVYNGEDFIIEALESIKLQDYENFQCNIINNCSTDDTRNKVEAFIRNDKRFTLHNFTDFVAIDKNWNRCIDFIDNAKYLKVVQADDILFPNAISSMVELMEGNPSAGIGSSYRLAENSVYGFGLDYLNGNLYKGEEILLAHLFDKMEITGSITQLFFRIDTLKQLDCFPIVFDPVEYHFDSRLAYEMFAISDLVFDFKVHNYTRRPPSSETMTKVYNFNTLIHGKESRLYRFKSVHPELNYRYKVIRQKYAYFLFKNKLLKRKDCIAWHSKFLKRPFKFSEYVLGILMENRFGAKFRKKN